MDKVGKPEKQISQDPKLLEGEKVIWTGQPELKVFRPTDWIRIPFSIFWLSVAVFISFSSIHLLGTGGWFFVVWMFMILSLGVRAIVGPPINEYLSKKRTQFVLTNKRAIVICSWWKQREKSRTIVGFEDIKKIEDKDGRGMIVFDDIPHYQQAQWLFAPVALAQRSEAPAFFDIKDVDKVFQLAQTISKENSSEELLKKAPESPIHPPQPMQTQFRRSISPDLFSEYLRPGEELLWRGQPDKHIGLTRKPELMGFLAVVLGASVFSIFLWFLIFHAKLQATCYILAWIYSFALVFSVAVFQEIYLRKSIYYGVTDQRLVEMIKLAYGQSIFKCAEITNLSDMVKSSYDDGTGSLYFTPAPKGLATALLGQEVVRLMSLNPMSRKEPIFLLIDKPDAVVRLVRDLRQKKGLADVSKYSSQERSMPVIAHASLKRIGKERYIAPLVVAKLFLFSPQAIGAWVGMLITSILACIAINMLHNCNWFSVLQSAGLTETTIAHVQQPGTKSNIHETKYSYLVEYNSSDGSFHQSRLDYDATLKQGQAIEIEYLPFMPDSAKIKKPSNPNAKFFDGSIQATWAFGVLFAWTIGIVFLLSQLKKGGQIIELLKTGVRASAVRLPDERVVLYVNHQPSICQRNYEFTVNGSTYVVKSITSVNQPRLKKVAVLFDPSNPDRAVVLDDLPGSPIISADDMSIEYSANSVSLQT